MGVVGIPIHSLKNTEGRIAHKGSSLLDSLRYGKTGKKLSSIVKFYNLAGSNSKERYAWIANI